MDTIEFQPTIEAKDTFLRFNNFLQPYYEAMMTASGLTEQEARLCIAYALATYVDFPRLPTLIFQGAYGTGKSEALMQMYKICDEPKIIYASSKATLRDDLGSCRTAIIDEADTVDERLLTDRYAKITGKKTVKFNLEGAQWGTKTLDIFGATVLARRTPITDLALRSRSIVIYTKYREGDFHPVDVDQNEFESIYKQIDFQTIHMPSDRVSDTFQPVMDIMFSICDVIGIDYALDRIKEERKNLRDGQGYDPQEACLHALDGIARDDNGKRITQPVNYKQNKVRDFVGEHFGIKLKVTQIRDILTQLGFEVKTIHGYPSVKVIPELLSAEGEE